MTLMSRMDSFLADISGFHIQITFLIDIDLWLFGWSWITEVENLKANRLAMNDC
jgi:hypothetical protein